MIRTRSESFPDDPSLGVMPFSKYLPEHMGAIKLAPAGPYVAGSFAELIHRWHVRIDDTGTVAFSSQADLRVYVRMTQADGNQAWSSPIYLEA
jgi:hypothetical protein